MIAKATLHGNDEAARALGRFYTGYRAPVLAFLCWKGVPESRREDLAQDFFMHLMSHSFLRRFDSEKGRFRTYLRAALVRYQDQRSSRTRRGWR